VNDIELITFPVGEEVLRFRKECWHVGILSNYDLQDTVIYGRRAEEGVVEVKPGDPFPVCSDTPSRDFESTFCNGVDLCWTVSPVREIVLFGLNQGIDCAQEIIEGACEVRICADFGCGQKLTDPAGVFGKRAVEGILEIKRERRTALFLGEWPHWIPVGSVSRLHRIVIQRYSGLSSSIGIRPVP
jgi:hypothetical protein